MFRYVRTVVSRLRALFSNRKAEREFDEEIQSHIELLVERYMRQGMSRADAQYKAIRQFGNKTLLQEENRDMQRFRWIDIFAQDLRYGTRMLIKRPLFTSIAIGTLAICIGANTAAFSLIDAVFMKSLPVKEPDRLIQFKWVAGENFYDLYQYKYSEQQ